MNRAENLLQIIREIVTHEIDIITEEEGWLEDYISTIVDKRIRELKQEDD